MTVVAYDFNTSSFSIDYDVLLNENTYISYLDSLLKALKDLYQQLSEQSPSLSSSVAVDSSANKNIDEEVLNTFGLMIGIRVNNPIREMHSFCLNSSVNQLKEVISQLLKVFIIPSSLKRSVVMKQHHHSDSQETLNNYGNSQGMAREEKDLSLSYQQFVALSELHVHSSGLASLIQQHQSQTTPAVSQVAYDLNHLRSGQLLLSLNHFGLDPTISFVLQICDFLLSEERKRKETLDEVSESDVKEKELVKKAEEALSFTLLALEKIQEAKESVSSGDIATAIVLLTDHLLQRLDDDEVARIEAQETGEEADNAGLIVPKHMVCLLLIER
jgi:hypothetical protein